VIGMGGREWLDSALVLLEDFTGKAPLNTSSVSNKIMSTILKAIFKRWFVKHGKSIACERIDFVKTSLQDPSPDSLIKVYLIATGFIKKQIQDYLDFYESNTIDEEAFLSCYATADGHGNRYFFYENWFYNYKFERSKLYKVMEWPTFTGHWIDIERDNSSGVDPNQDDRVGLI